MDGGHGKMDDGAVGKASSGTLEGGGLKAKCRLLEVLALAAGLEQRFPEPGLGKGQSGMCRSPGHR